MTRYDFTPLFRSTVGFDRLMRLLDAAPGWDDAAPSYPPYNIEKTADDAYRITLAVAGFGEDDIHIELRENTLTVAGERKETAQPGEVEYLHHGIDRRAFQRSFQLADYVTVVGATLEHGLLRIDLKREVPEAMKPRRIEIAAGPAKSFVGKAKKLVSGVGKVA